MSVPGPPPGTPVHMLVSHRARTAPEATAVAWSTGPVTARELDRYADRIAAALAGEAGRPVAVRVPPGPGRYAALLGVLHAGAHLIWSGTAAGGERGRAIFDAVRPAAVLVGDAPDEFAAAYAHRTGVPLVDVTTLPEGIPDRPPVDPRSWAYVAHTSGSTGRPKGVPQTHDALAQFSTWFAAEFRLGPGVRVAQWVAPEHDPAVCETFATLVAGAQLCPVPESVRAHPGRLLAWLAAERIDVLQTVPSFARELLRESTGRSSPRLALRWLLLMGEAVPEALVHGLHAAAPRIALANLYGPTETVAATWHRIPRGWRGPIPIGRPIPGREVLVLDESDVECPPGELGELVVRSPYVTPGYLDHPGEHPAFRPVAGRGPGPWYRTGDLGLRRPDGLLEYRGRRDQQVKIQGHRLELAEVEAALLRDDSVAECAVLPVPGPDGVVTGLVGYVVPRRDARPARWRAHVRRHFGDLLLPMRFRIEQDALPRTETGKVDRCRLAGSGQPAAAQTPFYESTPEDTASRAELPESATAREATGTVRTRDAVARTGAVLFRGGSMETITTPARSELVSRAAALGARLREDAPASEKSRRLTDETLAALSDSGLLRMRVPLRYDGYESDMRTVTEVVAELSRGDGSTGWTAAVWLISSWMTGLFPNAVRDEVFADPDVRISGILNPSAMAAPVDGGFRVSGKWSFNTGALQSAWNVNAAVRPVGDDQFEPVMVLIPMRDLHIVDDWHTVGMRGSGSVTTVAEDVFVPAERVVPMGPVIVGAHPQQQDPSAPMWRSPFMPIACTTVGAVAYGLAQAAKDAFMERLPSRKITYTDYADQSAAPLTHLQVAGATVRMDEAGFHILRTADLIDGKAATGEAWTIEERGRARLDLGAVCLRAKEVVDVLAGASGGTSLHTDVPIQRIERDIKALNLHAIMHPDTNFELYGRLACGLPPNTQYI